jgi:hypothetical protein
MMRAELTWRGAGTAGELELTAGRQQASACRCGGLGWLVPRNIKRARVRVQAQARSWERSGRACPTGRAGRQREQTTTKETARVGAGTGVVERRRVFWTCCVGSG